ncbi:hypothetical protein [Pseudalkalibacillus sp. SCS-8]|uniref:hypothetical protein n=1 Tax=Pseudalkalibacillus nanhaiensis TaxID=3115291 RepID=UPI0032DA192C
MNFKKYLFGTLSAFLTVGLLFGCAAGDGEEEQEPTEEQEPAEEEQEPADEEMPEEENGENNEG